MLASLDHKPAALGARLGERSLPCREIARGRVIRLVPGASIERALGFRPLFEYFLAALGTLGPGLDHERLGVAARRVMAARDKLAESPHLDDEWIPAVGARSPIFLGWLTAITTGASRCCWSYLGRWWCLSAPVIVNDHINQGDDPNDDQH